MVKRIKSLALFVAISAMVSAQNVTEGWGTFKLFLDPGHSQNENVGLYGYSEAKKTVRVAKHIKNYLLTYTDMPESCLMLCRDNDDVQVALSERSDMANAWDADFYYSIHSDAAANTNTTLTMYGGWCVNGVEIEKVPYGGKAFGEILNPNLTGIMRITTRGNFPDRKYYDRSSTHSKQYPYLSVNRLSNMASLLSEAGFHTLDEQQSRNINDDYKKLEAFAAFQSILKYLKLRLPDMTMLTGVATDVETGKRLDGVDVTVDGKTYTTDSWESVFYKYTDDKDLIHNGFYVFEGLQAGKTYDVLFEKKGYESVTKQVTIKAGNQGKTTDYTTFLDVQMKNITPSQVDCTSPANLNSVALDDKLVLTFTRDMDKTSVINALTITPEVKISTVWQSAKELVITSSAFANSTTYTIKIDGSVAKNSQTGQLLDGDKDGTDGGVYELKFTTEAPDSKAPFIESTYPPTDGEALCTYRPVIRIAYNEKISWNSNKVNNFVSVVDSDGNTYSGKLTHAVVKKKSVLHFYLNEDLPRDKCIQVRIEEGVTDIYGNAAEASTFKFLTEYRTRLKHEVVLPIEGPEGFWEPATSGSSKGLVASSNTVGTGYTTISPSIYSSMSLYYSFEPQSKDGEWCIREHYENGAATAHNDIDGVLSFWVYGDGSNNLLSARVYANESSSGIKYRNPEEPIDFIGWKLINWDMKNDPYKHFTGSDELKNVWRFDSFFLRHYDRPDMAWSGMLYFNSLEYNKFSASDKRTAKITDIAQSGIEDVSAEESNEVDVYNLQGIKIKEKVNRDNATEGLPAGLYIVGGKKVVVK